MQNVTAQTVPWPHDPAYKAGFGLVMMMMIMVVHKTQTQYLKCIAVSWLLARQYGPITASNQTNGLHSA